MIVILGDFDVKSNRFIVICLSKEAYPNVKIIINSKHCETIDVKAYQVERICLNLDKINISKLNIKFETEHKQTLSKITGINLSGIFDRVEVVNCDSTYGVEKNMWGKIANIKSHFIIHCGDQIYNDYLFKKYYRYNKLKHSDITVLKKEIFCAYYNQFKRYKQILKNNLNLMIPDDHEIVDDGYENKYGKDTKFTKLKKIFNSSNAKIQLGLRLRGDDIYYLKDNKNDTIYVLNYQEKWTEKLLSKYYFDSMVNPYKNVILISRKSVHSYKYCLPNKLVYSCDQYNLVDIDFLINKFIHSNKNFFILCGDQHSYEKSVIKNFDGKIICTVITCGPINSVPVLFKDKIISNTKIPNISQSIISNLLVNSFVRIKYVSGKIFVDKVIYKTDPITNIWDNIISAINFL